MTSQYLIDSGIFIRVLRGDRRAADLVIHLSRRGRVSTSVIVVLEVFRGCRGQRERAIAGDLFAQADIVDLVYELATAASEIIRGWPGVFSSEKAVPDAIITASALATTATLVTLNTRQFSRLRIPGLSLLLIDQQAATWIPPST